MSTLEISMQSGMVQCGICDKWTPLRWSVPTYNGDLVSNQFPDELYRNGGGNMPVCVSCFGRHACGEFAVFDECYLASGDEMSGGLGI